MTLMMVFITQVDDAIPLIVLAMILGALTARWLLTYVGDDGDD